MKVLVSSPFIPYFLTELMVELGGNIDDSESFFLMRLKLQFSKGDLWV